MLMMPGEWPGPTNDPAPSTTTSPITLPLPITAPPCTVKSPEPVLSVPSTLVVPPVIGERAGRREVRPRGNREASAAVDAREVRQRISALLILHLTRAAEHDGPAEVLDARAVEPDHTRRVQRAAGQLVRGRIVVR